MRAEVTCRELAARLTHTWYQLLGEHHPKECAATCLVSMRTRDGRLLVGGIGDGLAVVTGTDEVGGWHTVPLRGGEFGETVALGDGREGEGWVVEEFDDREARMRVMLASDGVSQDLVQDRIPVFVAWLVATFGSQTARTWPSRLRHEIEAWPTPGASDDRTLVVMWTEPEVDQ